VFGWERLIVFAANYVQKLDACCCPYQKETSILNFTIVVLKC